MKYSQYLNAYIEGNNDRIRAGDLPITVGTFINQQLVGRASAYGQKYAQALKRSCIAIGATEVASKGGGIAYVKTETVNCGECLVAHVDIVALRPDGSCGCCDRNHNTWARNTFSKRAQ